MICAKIKLSFMDNKKGSKMNQPIEIENSGTCQCECVKFNVKGIVLANALCHCKTCCYNRGMTPVHIHVISDLESLSSQKPFEGIEITDGKNYLKEFEVEDTKVLHVFCIKCGVMVYQTPKNRLYKTVLPTNFHIEDDEVDDCVRDGKCKLPEEYRPRMHMNYRYRHYDSNDDLPKFVTWFPNPFYPDEGMCNNKGEEISDNETYESFRLAM